MISDKEQGTARVVRGHFSLLYCIMSRSVANDDGGDVSTSLCQASDCLVCERKGSSWEMRQLRKLTIDSMIDGRWEHLEFQPSLDRIGR